MSSLLPELNERAKQALMILARSQAPVTCSSLAGELGVSERTVRSDLDQLRSWAADHSMSLIVKPRIGVSIGPDEARRHILAEITSGISSRNDSLTGRVPRILWHVLSSGTPVTQQELASTFFVSPNTLRKDLARVRRWLDSRCIELATSRHGGGLGVECSEWRRRMALSEVAQITSSDEYLAIKDTVELVLQDLQKRGDLVLTGSAYYGVVCYLSIAALRIRQGKLVEPQSLDWTTQIKAYRSLVSALRSLAAKLGFFPHENEVGAACAYIMSLSFNGQQAGSPEDGRPYLAGSEFHIGGTRGEAKPKLLLDGRGCAKVLAILVGNAMGADLLSDTTFVEDLGAHLTLAFSRMASGTSTYNPFKAELKRLYPKLYDSTVTACRRFERLTGSAFTDDEVAYAVMYIGAALERYSRPSFTCLIVCASGTGVAKFLSERLMSAFPSIHVRALVPVPQLTSALLEFSVDLVISPTRIASADAYGQKILVVDPMLPAADRALIAGELSSKQSLMSWGRGGVPEGDRSAGTTDNNPINIPARATRHARQICERVARTFKWEVDPLMIKALGIHLEFARQRLKRGQVLSQPVAEFRMRYPALFHEVKTALEAVQPFECSAIPEEEVVPILVYFASSQALT